MRKLAKFFLIIFFISLSANTYAQLVNIEKERRQYKQGFQGSISFQFDIIQNTSQVIQGGNNAHLQFTHQKSTFLLLNDYSLMKVKKDENNFDLVNQNFQHLRYNYSLIDTNKLNIEAFIQRQQNKIKYLKLRFLTGLGMRFCVYQSKSVNFYFATLAMYENEILSDSAKTNTKMLKGDLYLSLSVKFSNSLLFSNVTYYQPALADLNNYADFERFKDFRIYSETSFSFKILKNIEYSMVFQLSYDSRPPVELVSTPLFYNFTNQLTFKF